MSRTATVFIAVLAFLLVSRDNVVQAQNYQWTITSPAAGTIIQIPKNGNTTNVTISGTVTVLNGATVPNSVRVTIQDPQNHLYNGYTTLAVTPTKNSYNYT